MLQKLKKWLAVSVTAGMLVSGISVASAATMTQLASTSGPVRGVTRCADGSYVGGKSLGSSIEVDRSTDGGATWTKRGTVASSSAVTYGDAMFLSLNGTNTVYCAFREQNNSSKHWTVTVCKSTDSGASWTYDSTIIADTTPFVGAPWLFIANNGDMLCFYDSEKLASDNGHAGSQWIAMQGRSGKTGAWTKYGVVTASRDADAAHFCRDGMATAADLGNNRIIVVTEGVEQAQTGGTYANVIREVESYDGGLTWDLANRKIIYQSRVDTASGKRFNAYCPMVSRINNGPAGVVFCTDEDFSGPPDASSAAPDVRRAHVKYISTTTNFETWSVPTAIWTAGSKAYTPSLFQRATNDLLVNIDHFSNQTFWKMVP